ncbi:hypothetical protein BOX15_Mlig031012g1 [Macrostomum lignano]|uniref:Uncharacterized protein n=1 Tax=Macrostomum lignano TaxID=282301 RepID=A0A267GGA1_9PLAT|nr:hypothetical protein BOX15_Mlig031012g1 [Macrostomum lignano]
MNLLLLLVHLLLCQPQIARVANAQLQNADRTGGVSVRLTLQQPPERQLPKPQPPKPSQKELRRGKLTKLLGSGGQEDLRLGWLSVRPRVANPGGEFVELQPEQQTLLNRQLAAVNASPPSVRGWLTRLAACPGRANWTDLGDAVWPRWARSVECGGGASCGWPPGLLRCGAQRRRRPRRLQLLRWRCSNSFKRQLRRRLRRLRRRRRQRRDKKAQQKRRNSAEQRKKKKSRRWNKRMRSIAERLSVVAGEFECRWSPHEISVVSEVCVCGGR